MQPFRPRQALTVNIDVSSSSQAVWIGRCDSLRVMNNGTATVWIALGDSTVTASTTTSMPIGPGGTEVIRFQNNDLSPFYAAAIAAGSTGKIYFTPGDGV